MNVVVYDDPAVSVLVVVNVDDVMLTMNFVKKINVY